MRNQLLFAAIAATSLLGACKWTDFDDLEDKTWVRSTQDPDIGSSDYAVAIAGVSSGASGGTLAVVSDDNAFFSTLEYDKDGGDSVGANPVDLGTQKIGAIAEAPVFATDPTGRIAIVERSILAGSYAVLFGSATAPVALEFAAVAPAAPSPDAAVFVPSSTGTGFDLLFAAGNTLYVIAPTGGTPTSCTGMDNNAMPLQVAAMDHDGTNLWVWTKSGSLFSYPLLNLCPGGTLPVPSTAFTPTAALMPAAGARIHVVGGFAILTGHPMTTRSGSVFVVKLADLTQVGTAPITVEGLRTSAVAVLEGETYVALGVPDRSVEGVAAGEVDLLAFNTTSGALDATPTLSLHDAQPESGQLYGRTVTTMSFNGNPILVVGADSEVFAYFRTTLYDHLP